LSPLALTCLNAGVVTTSPAHEDRKIVVAKDESVTFTATPDSGDVTTTLTIDPSGPSISGSGSSQTATFAAGTEGKSYTCTLSVTHTDGDVTCTDGQEFSYTVYVPKLVEHNPNNSAYPKKLYYLQNPSEPVPSDVEYKKYQLEGVAGLDLGEISWSSNPGILNLIAEQGQEDKVNVKTIGENGTNETEIVAKWKGAEVASAMVKVRTKGEITRDYSSDEYDYTDWIVWVGWNSICGYQVADQFDDGIGNVGINEELSFEDRTDHISPFNWFSGFRRTGNFETLSTGIFPDHYGIHGANLIPYATNKRELPTVSEVLVSSVPQKYRIGSKTTGDGMLFLEHNVVWKRGYAGGNQAP